MEKAYLILNPRSGSAHIRFELGDEIVQNDKGAKMNLRPCRY